MGLFNRLSNGWQLGKISLRTIAENPSLMLFPVISGASLILITLSFIGGSFFLFGDQIDTILNSMEGEGVGNALVLIGTFIFYLVNYFIIVFFNVGLVHCAKQILEGRETTLGEGINYAQTRLGAILAWSALAATVGLILKTIQENSGTIGQIISGIVGVVWSIATFFVVPVIAYEDVTPIEAVKRSTSLMKEKWGESIGANFSFGLFSLIGIFFIALPLGFLLGFLIHPIAGVVIGVLAFILVQTAVSAANMVFLAAAYQHVNNEPTGNFDKRTLDGIFIQK